MNDASPSPIAPSREDDQQQQQGEQRQQRPSASISPSSPPVDNAPLWSLEDFEFGKQIGEGRFGSVYLAREKTTGYKVAIKAVRKDDVVRLDMRHQLQREVRLQKYASRHPHVLRMFACFWDARFVYLVTEYCEGGDLSQYRSQNALPSSPNASPAREFVIVDEPTVACWTRQLLEAVAFLHERKLVHRDIKPDNIMLKRGRVKLGDFTWCVSLGQQPPFDRRRTICGTLDYLSPELVSHMPYDSQLDVWSVGVVVYELLVGSPPFEHSRPVDTCLSIQRGEFAIPPGTMSAAAEEFVRSALVVEPTQRAQCTELLKHPWIVNAPASPPSKARQRRSQSMNRTAGTSSASERSKNATTTSATTNTRVSGNSSSSNGGGTAVMTQSMITNTTATGSNNGTNVAAAPGMTTTMLFGASSIHQQTHHNLGSVDRQRDDDDVSRALELSGIGEDEDPASVSRATDVGE